MRARILASLYGAAIDPAPDILIVGDPDDTQSYLPEIQAEHVYAMGVWDTEKMESLSGMYSEVYIQDPPSLPWEQVVSYFDKATLCVLRHSLPVGAKLKEAQEMLSQEFYRRFPPESDFCALMTRLMGQKPAKNPIQLLELVIHMERRGWHYLGDLCGFRDFIQRERPYTYIQASLCDEVTGLLWRDSLFVRTPPQWKPSMNTCYRLVWRIHSESKVDSGWIYKTKEGMQIGLHHTKSLLHYQSWMELCTELPTYVEAFVQSGMLTLVEEN